MSQGARTGIYNISEHHDRVLWLARPQLDRLPGDLGGFPRLQQGPLPVRPSHR